MATSICPVCLHVNPADARFCNQCAQPLRGEAPKRISPEVLDIRAALEGERKLVSVLFADIKGSTDLVATVDAEVARQILDPVLLQMMEAVRHHGGTVNQLTGDGVMALFGAPHAQEDHAVRACAAAMRIQANLARHAEALQGSAMAAPRARVGINSGEVVVRSLSTDLNMEYTAVGLTTHLAARMEQMAPPGSVLITSATQRLAGHAISVKPQGPRAVSGLKELVEIYELTGVEDVRTRLQATRLWNRRRPFLGREAEMRALQVARSTANDGRPQALVIVGEAGVGKSRLVDEFASSGEASTWLVYRTDCLSYGVAIGYGPIVNLVKDWLEIADSDDRSLVKAKVARALAHSGPSRVPLEAGLLALLDAAADNGPWQQLDPMQKRQAIVDAVKHVIEQQCATRPLLLAFEDLQGIDFESLTVLEALLEELPPVRLLLIATCRPGPHPLIRNSSVRKVHLEALPAESAEQLLEIYLGTSEDLRTLRRQLVERTGGNPLFIEECISTLQESGAVVGSEGAFRLGDFFQPHQVPGSIQAIIAARIDRLDENDKRVLHAASILGKEFSAFVLQAMIESDEDAFRSAIERLQSSSFLVRVGGREDKKLAFRHPLIHEVTHSSLLSERRRDLNARALAAIQSVHRGELADHVERLARHALAAGLTERAIEYARLSGERAAARAAYVDATEFFRQALALLDSLPESPEILAVALSIRVGLGRALRATKAAADKEAQGCYIRALDLCDRLGAPPTERFPVVFGLWSCHAGCGEYDLASQTVTLLKGLVSANDPYMALEAAHAEWSTSVALGRIAEALSSIQRSRHLTLRAAGASWWQLGTHDPVVCSRQMSALAQWLLGNYATARSEASQAVRLATEQRHPFGTVIAHYIAAVVHYHCGDQGPATFHARMASNLGRFHGVVGLPEHAALISARLLAERGAGSEALKLVEANLRGSMSAGWPWSATVSVGISAEIFGLAGQHARGLDLLRALEPRHYAGMYGPELRRLLAKLHMTAGPGDEQAETHLNAAIELARDKQLKALRLRASIDLAMLLAKRSRRTARAALSIAEDFDASADAGDLRKARALRTWLS